jgi:hypothetical protein
MAAVSIDFQMAAARDVSCAPLPKRAPPTLDASIDCLSAFFRFDSFSPIHHFRGIARPNSPGCRLSKERHVHHD